MLDDAKDFGVIDGGVESSPRNLHFARRRCILSQVLEVLFSLFVLQSDSVFLLDPQEASATLTSPSPANDALQDLHGGVCSFAARNSAHAEERGSELAAVGLTSVPDVDDLRARLARQLATTKEEL